MSHNSNPFDPSARHTPLDNNEKPWNPIPHSRKKAYDPLLYGSPIQVDTTDFETFKFDPVDGAIATPLGVTITISPWVRVINLDGSEWWFHR